MRERANHAVIKESFCIRLCVAGERKNLRKARRHDQERELPLGDKI